MGRNKCRRNRNRIHPISDDVRLEASASSTAPKGFRAVQDNEVVSATDPSVVSSDHNRKRTSPVSRVHDNLPFTCQTSLQNNLLVAPAYDLSRGQVPTEFQPPAYGNPSLLAGSSYSCNVFCHIAGSHHRKVELPSFASTTPISYSSSPQEHPSPLTSVASSSSSELPNSAQLMLDPSQVADPDVTMLDADEQVECSASGMETTEGKSVSTMLVSRSLTLWEGAPGKRRTLCLDLDHTLIYATTDPPQLPDGVAFTVSLQDISKTVHVIKRPGVQEFLQAMAQLYELVLFTASTREYASTILAHLDPQCLFSHHLFRDACSLSMGGGGYYIKDLSLLGRELSSTILIDDSPLAFSLQPENAIWVSPFTDDMSDTVLLKLIPILSQMANLPGDVRRHLLTFSDR